MNKIIGISVGIIALLGIFGLVHLHRLNKEKTQTSSSGVTGTYASSTNQANTPTNGQAFPKVASGDYTFSFVTPDSLTRTYLVHIPKGYNPSTAYPVLFGFHGGFGNAAQFEQSTGFSTLADERGFIVVYGQGTAPGVIKAPEWNAGSCCGKADALNENIDDVGYVRDVVTQVKAKYNVDPSRIYTTGMSNGGIFSNRLACEASDIFAGAAIVSGTIQVPTCNPSRQIPILLIHGTSDTNVPYYGGKGSGMVNATFMPVEQEFADWGKRNGCSGAIITTSIPPLETTDGHTVDKLTYPSCAQQTVLYRINGGIHEWPSGAPRSGKIAPSKALNASLTILDFFHL